MQKIQKFQLGRIYSAPKSTKTYELIERSGHHLTFRPPHLPCPESQNQRFLETNFHLYL